MRDNRRIAVAFVLSAAVGLGLTACNSSGVVTPTATPTGTSQANTVDLRALELVKVDGPPGEEPHVVVPSTPFNVTTTSARLVRDGDGEALKPGQGLIFHRTTIEGYNGEPVATTWGSDPEPGLIVGGSDGLGNFDALLTTAHVGARILLGVPGDTQAGGTTGTVLFVIDIVKAYDIPAHAEGTQVPPVEGLPTVALDGDTPDSIAVTGEPPTSLVVQPLIQGTGPALAEGQAITVHYVGWLWDGTQFDSSWDDAPLSLLVGNKGVIAGWNEGLVGQTVGSRVLLVIPPDKAYGDVSTGSIPANATLVFVVDILAVN